MQEKVKIQTPFQKAHTHFYDYIESFPGLPEGESLQSQGRRIEANLKRQFIEGNEKSAVEYLKIRDCFSHESKKYVEFCLKEKLGMTVPEAARKLGIYKY